MANIHRTVLALLVLQIYVSAAPSDTLNVEEAVKIENGEPKPNITQPSSVEDNKDNGNSTENQRQKRFYNHYNPFGYDLPPTNPVPYPPYNKRDQASDLGVYGIDDPLSQIHRQLHDIASVVRQRPPPPPPVSQVPLFFPVIFIPQFACHCNCDSDKKTPATEKPVETSRPTAKPTVDGSTNSPDIDNRVPNIDDERQNWGLVVDETEEPEDDGEDFSRPISFDPIELDTSKLRPAPPVEHGSSQAGAANGGESTTTIRPTSNESPREPTSDRPSPSSDPPRPPAAAAAAGSVTITAGPYPPSSAESPREVPTTCDGAVLSCCHQLQVTYDCFSILGCPDPTSYGNPCDPLVILRVIGKYQNYYGVRTGS